MATAPILAVASADAADAMSAYRWKQRPLIVFASSASEPRLSEQKRIVATSRSAFAERDMVIVYVVGEKVSTEFGASPGKSAEALRAQYGVSRDGFKVVLVGKDGGTKLSSAQPMSYATLFGTIDAMPMRRDEMRGR